MEEKLDKYSRRMSSIVGMGMTYDLTMLRAIVLDEFITAKAPKFRAAFLHKMSNTLQMHDTKKELDVAIRALERGGAKFKRFYRYTSVFGAYYFVTFHSGTAPDSDGFNDPLSLALGVACADFAYIEFTRTTLDAVTERIGQNVEGFKPINLTKGFGIARVKNPFE